MKALSRILSGLGYVSDLPQSLLAYGLVRFNAAQHDTSAKTFLGQHFPGAQAEVISGQTEAELTFAGGVSDLRPEDGPFVVTDLGGGSTEIVVGELVGGQARLLGARSLDIGCVRITERCLHTDPPTADELAAAREFVSDRLAEALASVRGWVAERV